MIIQSKYTKIFKSNNITRLKYNELYDFAVLIQNHKNTLSKYVNNHLFHYLEYNKFGNNIEVGTNEQPFIWFSTFGISIFGLS